MDSESSYWQPFVIFLILVIITLVGVVMSVVAQTTTNDIITNNVLTGQGLKNYMAIIGIIPQMDYVICFIYIVMNLAVLYRAVYVKGEPIDYVIGWFISLIIIWISFFVSNIFVNVFRSAALATGIAWFSQALYIVRWFPAFEAVFLGAYTILIITRLRDT